MAENLNFHLTFPPSRDLLSRLITHCPEEVLLSKEEISEITGIPTGKNSGKVEPHICYAQYMGLLVDKRSQGKHSIHLSCLGNVIREEDPGLNEDLTLMVCHMMISSPYTGASLWSKIFNNILPAANGNLTEIVLEQKLTDIYGGVPRLGPFYSSYSDLFSRLRLLEHKNGNICLVKHKYMPELIYAYAYQLFLQWEIVYPSRNELSSTEINSLESFACLGWDNSQLYSLLEMLAEKHLILFNRQMAPYTITQLHSSDSIIPLLYSELC